MTDWPKQPDTAEFRNNEQVKNKLDFLEDQTRRLSNELLMYQKATGMGISFNDMEKHVDLPIWMENEQVMSPLLLAYDSRIQDLGTYMEQQGAYLDAVTERSSQVLKENEELRTRLMSKIENTVAPSDASRENAKDPSSTKYRALLEENELLRKQADLLTKELHQASKTIATRDKGIEELNDQIRCKFEAISKLGKAVNTSSKRQSFCESALSEKLQEIVRLKLSISRQSSNIETLKREKSEMRMKQKPAFRKTTVRARLAWPFSKPGKL